MAIQLKRFDFTISLEEFGKFKGDFKANGLKLKDKNGTLMQNFENKSDFGAQREPNGSVLTSNIVCAIKFDVVADKADLIFKMLCKYNTKFN